MKSWWVAQSHAWRTAVAAIRREPFAWLASAGVVASAVVLPVLLHLGVGALAPTVRGIATDPEISVYLVLDASAGDFREAQALIEERLAGFRATQPAARITLVPVPKADALERFRAQAERAGNAAAFAALKDNPLPDGFVIRAAGVPAAALDELAVSLRKVDKVDAVQLDAEWVRRLAAALRAAVAIQWGLAVLFAAVVVAVTFNATHAQALALRDEIEIARLIGATHAFIRRPFVVRGAVLGLAGAALALGIAVLVVSAAARVFDADPFSATGMGWLDALTVLAVVAALGGAGGWWSATRHLRRFGG